jgi:hypothetical protein
MNSKFIVSYNQLSGFPYVDKCNICGSKQVTDMNNVYNNAIKNGVTVFDNLCHSIICEGFNKQSNLQDRVFLCFSSNQSSDQACKDLCQSGQTQSDILQPFDHTRVRQESLEYHYASLSLPHHAPIEEAYLHNN